MSYPNLEGNKLIAQFMGYKYEPGVGWFKGQKGTKRFDYISRHHRDLKYDCDYNWMFKVIAKIESLGYFFYLAGSRALIVPKDGTESGSYISSNQQFTRSRAIYDVIVQFVKNFDNF